MAGLPTSWAEKYSVLRLIWEESDSRKFRRCGIVRDTKS
jgi:hypothetical protein